MIHYIIQVVAFQILFLMVYDFFLKKETFFSKNRIYLLVTPVLSLLMPFIKVSAITQSIPQQIVHQLGGANQAQIIELDTVLISIEQSGWSTSQVLIACYLLGITISLAILCYKAYRLFKLKKSADKYIIQGIPVFQLPNTDAAFSFFGAMFLGDHISETQRETIFQHEKIHIEQRHSLDLLFFEILRVILWFNPLIYIFQNRITLLQEFIADNEVAQKQSKDQYCESLLSQVFQTQDISFINTFFNHSLIKKRIIMLQKSKSNRVLQLKYLLLVPLVFGMLIYTSCSDDEKTSIQDVTANQVVETGTTNKNRKSNELNTEKGNIRGVVTNASGSSLPGVNVVVKGTNIRAQTDFDGVYSIDAPKGSDLVFSYLGLKSADVPISKSNVYNVVLGKDNVEVEVKNVLNETASLLPPSPGTEVVKTYQEKEIQNLQDDTVPFATVDKVPVYPGCEGASTNEERKKCMSKAIIVKVKETFNTKIAEQVGLEGRHRISVQFKIDKTGNVVDIIARASHPDLQAEAIRSVSALPKMIPGQQGGKNVAVLYSLPIVFQFK